MFYKISLAPQVEWSVNISNKHGVFELPHDLHNDLILRILGNQKKPAKSSLNYSLVPRLTLKEKMLVKNCWKMEIELFL